MDLKNIHESKVMRGVLAGIGVSIIALLIFQAGQVTGYRKARFVGNFGNNFEKNFIDPRGGKMKAMLEGGGPSGHGAVGEIMAVNLPRLVVVGSDNIEKTVVLSTSTRVHQFREEVGEDQLKIGSFVVVLGSPNNEGQIEAKLIRLLPAPNDEFMRRRSR